MELEFALYILLLSFHMYYGEAPLSSCNDLSKPYKTMNNSCLNFKDVCVKTGDRECDNFQRVCNQCPSSNFSMLMYLDMINIKDKMVSMKSDDLTKIGISLIILYILVGIILLLLLFLFLEVVFKIFTKCCRNQSEHNGREYRCIQNTQGELDMPLNQLNQENGQYSQMSYNLKNFEEKIMGILKESLQNSNCNVQKTDEKIIEMENTFKLRNNMKFKISGSSRPIELFIRPNENVLEVKREICSHWPAAKPGDYKIMIIKFKCQPLNDHNNFMSYNIPTNSTLDCELDNKLNKNDYLILKLQGTLDLPELLKISKEKTISDIKTFITCYNNNILNPIIREMKTGQELRNEMNLRNSKLQDDDWIDIITETNRKLTVKSFFNEYKPRNVEFSNIDMILTIKNQIKSQLTLNNENIILFWNNLHLEDDKYIQDYKINDEFPIKFCYLNIFDGEPIQGKNFSKKEFNSLYKGNHSNKNVFIQKYELKENIFIIKSPSFINQLINCQIINSHPRFMSLCGIYLDKTNLFVLMENRSEEIITEKIENGVKFSENEIAGLSTQILEGLKYLHDNNIVHKNLKPTNIFVDSLRNIKLSSFNLIQTLDIEDEQILDVHPFPCRYWAPEILKMEPFTAKSDVWSFGAVLVFIATCDKPYPNLSDADAGIEIVKYSKIDFDISKFSEGFLDFVNTSLHGDADKRPIVDELLMHPFLKQ